VLADITQVAVVLEIIVVIIQVQAEQAVLVEVVPEEAMDHLQGQMGQLEPVVEAVVHQVVLLRLGKEDLVGRVLLLFDTQHNRKI
jgi:hypothetical protein